MKKMFSYTIFWILQCTWGIIMTLIGGLVALALLITGHKPHHIGPTIYFKVGKNWGGFEMGGFFICDQNCNKSLMYHECGHGIQNLIFGPLFPFIITIPSATRYWLRKIKTHLCKVIYANIYLIISILLFTGLILAGTLIHCTVLIRVCEILRIYFSIVAIWLILIEIPRYEHKEYYGYDDIWFEGQATKFGKKYYEKKEG